MKRRITALLTILCMVLTMMPLHVHATEAGHVHYGGTATCKWKATCEGCGSNYGETDPNNHNDYFGEDNGDGRTHTAMCTCGHVYNASEAHDFSGWEEDGPGQEARFCYECYYTETRSTHTHSYSEATCTAPATCSCGATTGGVSSSNHAGGTEVRNAKDASEFEPGYTGDTYCLGCDTKIASGTTIPATHTHSYSTATCTTPATCSCGATTGGVDKSNHVGGTETRGYEAAGEFTDGYTGDTYCLGCGEVIAYGETIPATHTHAWEWASDSELHWQKCSSCGESSTAAQAHTFETVVIPPTATEEGGYVSICSVCNYEEHLHIYSDATCTTPATCSCGATRGDVDKSNHVGGTEVRDAKDATETEDGYTGDTYCLGCGDKLADGQTIPATHQHSYTAVVTAPTCKEQGYTTYTCSCNDSYVSDYVDALGHDWGDCVSIGNGRHKLVCGNDSSHEQTTNCGGRATCHELAFCSDCKTTYGEYDQDNHSGGTEVRNAKKATETENGYTGDTYCLGCNVLISEGSIIYATGSGDDDDDTHTHNYSYYKFDGTNHWKMCHCGQGQAGSVKPHSLVITGASTGHVEECTVCNYFSDVEAHVYSDDSDAYCNECGYRRHVHDQSTAATCKSPAKCSCGVTTGGKDPTNHTGGTEIRNAKEATRTETGYTGDTYCLGCGSMIASGEVIPKAGVIFDGPGVEDVTFIPAEGTELPRDAEIIVNPHTPSGDDLDFVLGIDADTEYLDADDVKIQIVGGGVYTAPDGTKYSMYEIILINGEEYLITNYMGTGDVLGLMRLSDGATCGYKAAVNVLDFTGSLNGTVQDYAYDKVNIGGVTYDVKLSYANAQGTIEVILYYNGSPAAKLRNYEACYFLEGFDPETLKAQQNVNDLGTVTTGENPFDGLESGKTYNVSVIGSNDISVPGYDEALLNSIKTETEAEKAAKAEVERLKADMEAKRAALEQLDANDPDHMEAWAAWYEAEIAYKEALAELAALTNLQSATVTQKFQIPDELVGRTDVTFVAVHNTNPFDGPGSRSSLREDIADFIEEWLKQWEKTYGSEIGTVEVYGDGQTLTATYTVNSFSPFTVYAFTEAELPEIKEFVTQPDGTLARVVNGQPVATHTVASGENLTVIARKYGCTVDEIVALNSDLIENPSKIYVGWVLTIPEVK